MTTLSHASAQWANRPADERFQSISELHAAAMGMRRRAATAQTPMAKLHVVHHEGTLKLNGEAGRMADLTHWSFGQLARIAEAPAGYLRSLPGGLAAQCIDDGLKRHVANSADNACILFDRPQHEPEVLITRAITSEKYSRIWNSDVTQRLLDLEQEGLAGNGTTWQPAPAAFDGSRGLYLGNQDMFAFLVDSSRRIFEKAPGGGLSRGFFCWNSEVGSKTFGIMTFLYEYICGNHIVWEARDVKEIRVRHIGDASRRGFGEFVGELRKYADSSTAHDEAKIMSARNYQLGKDKDAVLDAVFGLRIPQLSQRLVGQAYDVAEKHLDWYGSPRTVWGMVNGITQIARDLPNASERDELDRAAGKVLAVAF